MTVTKREPLPWFPFNIAEYVTDTMRLSRDAHGAYLLLMLDYYGTTTPCPDDDFILAAVTKSTETEWAQLRKMLAPFFDIRDGHWFHKRIEREIEEGSRKVADRKLLAEAGGRARAAQMLADREKNPKTPGKSARTAASSTAVQPSAQPAAQPPGEPAATTLTLTLKKDSLSTEAVDQDEDEGIGSPIDPKFRPDPETMAECILDADEATVENEILKFILHHQHEGSFSKDWQAAFKLRWVRYREHAAKQKQAAKLKAAPRVVVDANAPYVPTEKDYRQGLKRPCRRS